MRLRSRGHPCGQYYNPPLPFHILPSVATAPIVEIDRVSFGYDRARPVLHGVSLRIEPGSVVGIMGQSGCGKTTLLRIVAGWLKPSAGGLRVLGRDVAALDGEGIFALRRKIGMLFQFGALFTDM